MNIVYYKNTRVAICFRHMWNKRKIIPQLSHHPIWICLSFWKYRQWLQYIVKVIYFLSFQRIIFRRNICKSCISLIRKGEGVLNHLSHYNLYVLHLYRLIKWFTQPCNLSYNYIRNLSFDIKHPIKKFPDGYMHT